MRQVDKMHLPVPHNFPYYSISISNYISQHYNIHASSFIKVGKFYQLSSTGFKAIAEKL